jgi:uncharacterized lipoprotein YmbA
MPNAEYLEMVSVRVRTADVEALNAKAKRQACTLSDVLRQIIAKAARAELKRAELTEAANGR